MNKVDTFFDGRDIHENKGLYFIVKDGQIISKAFTSLKSAQNNAWRFCDAETAAAEEIQPVNITTKMIVDASAKIEEVNTSSFDNIVQNFYEKEKLLRECLYYFHRMIKPPLALKCAIEQHLRIKFEELEK